MAERKTNSKPVKKSTGDSSSRKSTATRSTSQKGTSGRQMEMEDYKKTSSKNQKKNPNLGKDVAIIFIAAACIVMYVAAFAHTPEWLDKGLSFVFGWLRFVAPALIVFLFIILFYHEVTGTTIRRIFAVFLMFFGFSGIFSFLSEVENGGLLGRLNYWMFNGWLQKAGSVIFNIVFILVSIVLLIDFSVFSYLKDKEKIQREKTKERIQKAEEEREVRRLERENQEMINRHSRQTTLEEYREKNRKLQEYEEHELQRQYDNEERFRPKKGICDTTIKDDSPVNTETTFHFPVHNPTTEENPTLDNQSIFGKYHNPGDDIAKDSDDEPLDEVDIEEAPLPTITYNQNGPDTKNSEAEKPKDLGSSSSFDKYEKIVVTANGKLNRVESDISELRTKETTEEVKKNVEEEPETQRSPKKIMLKEYKFPPIRLLNRGPQSSLSRDDLNRELTENAQKLKQALQTFGIGVTVTDITCGPSVTRYEIQPEVGVKVSRITALEDDIKYYLAAKDIRIEAPIPGKSAIGIEVPNKAKTGVYIRDLIESEEFQNSKSKLSFVLGRDIEGHTIISDIAKMPHVLIAGTTGSGKSVCLNTMIMSIIYHAKPTEVKMIMVDPKMVEMQIYNKLPHLLLPVITDPRRASAALNWACQEMDKRYGLFAKYQVRGIDGFNEYVEMETAGDEDCDHLGPDYNPDLVKMPQIVIFVDEMSDMMMVARKEVEESIIRLAQKARAAGIHLVLATQSPRAEVLTGLIKANVPSRIALSVSSGLESRIIIDMNGAETLLGHGDMLYLPSGANKPARIQGAFVSDKEIADVMAYLSGQTNVKGGGVSTDINLDTKPEAQGAQTGSDGDSNSGWDELFEQCGRFVIDNEKGTIGALQRKFSIGFNRAARIMDQLCEAGVVGEEEGTKPRRILMSTVQFDDFLKANKI